MPNQAIFHHTFANGLTLLAERMDTVRSAAMNFLLPAGCVYDAPEYLGTASLLAELIKRGAGAYSSRELMLALDGLGLDRDESTGTLHLRLWGSTLARNLLPALERYADILRRPHLPDAELEPAKALAIQDLESLEDDPKSKVLVELKKRHLPPPLGRDRRGTPDGIAAISIDTIRRFYQRYVQPRGAILSIAGNIDWPALRDTVERCFADWEPQPDPSYALDAPLPRRSHLDKDTKQTQIGIAYDSVPISDPDYYAAVGAVNILSGGMSARLFTEVREKRGLCYAVWATYQTFKDRASIFCYAGSTNERAQETLDVTLAELKRLKDGIEVDEVERVQAGLKSSLIMQEESTSARAGSIASDWYYFGRVRTFDEIQTAINNLSTTQIVEHVRRCPAEKFTLVTLGPKPLAA